MFPLRQEIHAYSRACEHLIASTALAGAIPFTADEIEWITYYGGEMTSFVDRLAPKSKDRVLHNRQTIHDFVVAGEALMRIEDLSDEERDHIRQSVSSITKKILGAKG